MSCCDILPTHLIDGYQVYVVIHRVFLKLAIVDCDCFEVYVAQRCGGSLCTTNLISHVFQEYQEKFSVTYDMFDLLFLNHFPLLPRITIDH